MKDLRTVGPWAVMPLKNDRLERYVVVDMHPAQGTGKRQVATHIRSFDEANLLAAAPALRDALVRVVQAFKELADSGDAGNWKFEDTPEGEQALDALFSIGWELQS